MCVVASPAVRPDGHLGACMGRGTARGHALAVRDGPRADERSRVLATTLPASACVRTRARIMLLRVAAMLLVAHGLRAPRQRRLLGRVLQSSRLRTRQGLKSKQVASKPTSSRTAHLVPSTHLRIVPLRVVSAPVPVPAAMVVVYRVVVLALAIVSLARSVVEAIVVTHLRSGRSLAVGGVGGRGSRVQSTRHEGSLVSLHLRRCEERRGPEGRRPRRLLAGALLGWPLLSLTLQARARDAGHVMRCRAMRRLPAKRSQLKRNQPRQLQPAPRHPQHS